jgi:hypothetical protein
MAEDARVPASLAAAPRAGHSQPDQYAYLSRGGTLWSWPGQNPFRWRDPSGRAGIAIGIGGDAGFCAGLCVGSWAGGGGIYVGTEGFGVYGSGQVGAGVGAHAGYGVQGSFFSSLDAFKGLGYGVSGVAGLGVIGGGSVMGNPSGVVVSVAGGAGGGLYGGAAVGHTWTYGVSWQDIKDAWHFATKPKGCPP